MAKLKFVELNNNKYSSGTSSLNKREYVFFYLISY